MAYLDYSLIPYKEKRSTGERVLRNAFYMPDPKLHKSSLYSGDYPDDFSGLEIDPIIPLRDELVEMLNW